MTQDEKPEHKVGKRCCLGEHRGTIRYVGQVPPTKGKISLDFYLALDL